MRKLRQNFTIFIIFLAITGILHGVFTLCSLLFFTMNKPENKNQNYGDIKHVLYISSFNNIYDNVEKQLKGFDKVFDSSGINVDVLYMDAQYHNDSDIQELYYRTLKIKIARNPHYDAVILGDDDALYFGEKYQQELFKDTPIFFLGINDLKHAEQASKNPFISGCAEKSYLQETVEIAMKFFPESRSVIAIYDNSNKGKISQQDFYALKSNYPGYLFRGINTSEISRETFAKRLSTIEPKTILISLDYIYDSAGNQYSTLENTRFVSKNCSVPVFTTNISSIGKGFVGGKVLNYEEMGRLTAISVKDVVSGVTDITTSSFFTTLEANYYFDNDVMRKFQMNSKLLPDDTVFANNARNYWNQYSRIIVPFIEISAFLLVLILILISHIFELRTSKLQIEHDSRFDRLTGLYNRYSMQVKLKEVMSSKERFSVFLVDINDFRAINDFNSHDCGDAVIKEVANRLFSLTAEEKYIVSRFSGDKFLLIYKGGHIENSDPEILFIRQLLGNCIEYADKNLFLMTSIGIVNSNDLFTVEDYFSNADIAMNEAKKLGKNKYLLFTDDMREKIKTNADIASVLENACKTEEFNVVYQPQIDISTGKIHGYEALVRLSNAKISPAVFIPIAEKDGHISKIGRIVTEKVIKQLADWRDCGLELYPVSINFSAAQVGDSGYIQYLRKLMRTYDISSDLIGIEITESLFLGNTAQASEVFNQFDDIGIKIALDDFGTGYSSLNYLTHLPIETVKLDKSTVDTYLDGKASFIENIVSLVHSLGMKITVEGVENMWQYDKLKSFKCDYIQGYFFSKPLSGEEIKAFKPPVLM